jgi:hypothetical protein
MVMRLDRPADRLASAPHKKAGRLSRAPCSVLPSCYTLDEYNDTQHGLWHFTYRVRCRSPPAWQRLADPVQLHQLR